MSKNVIVNPGDEVKIFTSELNEDPNQYIVDDIKRSVVCLTCKETGREIKVHKTRIKNICGEENEMSDETVTTTLESDTDNLQPETQTETQDKTRKPSKPKAEPVKVDFDKPPFENKEIWTKSCNFDFDSVQVEAHCVILDDGYQIFNTYNGALGKKNWAQLDESTLPGVFYSFTEKMTADKKRENLQKKGYSQSAVAAS